MEWSQTYGKLYYYRGIWMGDFLLGVLFSVSPWPTAGSQLQRVARQLPQNTVHTQSHVLVATYNCKQFIWGVLQEKVKSTKKSLISGLFLGSSHVQEEYSIPTQDAKGQWNTWDVMSGPDLPHRVQSRPCTRWHSHYSHRANILLSGRERIQRRRSEIDTAQAFSLLKRSILVSMFWEE